MCLSVNSHQGIIVAGKDILVCKMIDDVKRKFFFWKYWIAPYMGTKHKFNTVLEATKHLRYSINWFKCQRVIHIGFHALRSTKLIDDEIGKYAIIPKGAEYCIGAHGDIVANKMIVFSSKRKYEKYVSKC